ncbi:MAG TPA: hypothetical protein VER03_22055 [Bryobacteraceae bacterium]|nr:hypothetical protein [Bryobacteraceae bacterium]
MIRRTIAEVGSTSDPEITKALQAAYPFDESPVAQHIWREALKKNVIQTKVRSGARGGT